MYEKIEEALKNNDEFLASILASSLPQTEKNEALALSAVCGLKDVVKLLLRYDADVHARNDEALRWAAENGHTAVVKLLEEHIERRKD